MLFSNKNKIHTNVMNTSLWFMPVSNEFHLHRENRKVIKIGCIFRAPYLHQEVWHQAGALTAHYENTPIQIYWKFYHQKMAIFQIKKCDIFHISAQNIDCGYSLEPPRRGGSNEYPQSMFLSRNNKNNVYPCKPQFYYIKVGFKGVKII